MPHIYPHGCYFNSLDEINGKKITIMGLGYLTGTNEGGASTLTMQISKNTFTSKDAEGFKGLVRKFTDIYMSIFNSEKDYSKEEIMEFYVNSPYLGAGSYGVVTAAKTYFNKDISNFYCYINNARYNTTLESYLCN